MTAPRPLRIDPQANEDILEEVWAEYHSIPPEHLEEYLYNWERADLYLLIDAAMVNYDRAVWNGQVLAERHAKTISGLEALRS